MLRMKTGTQIIEVMTATVTKMSTDTARTAMLVKSCFLL